MRKIAFLFVYLVLAISCQARIITVEDDGPADFNNIQAAINDANEGDTVLVADGIYTGTGNKNLDFDGKAITVKSSNGPANCIIDCENSGRGFNFHSSETSASVVEGFAIINGDVVGDVNYDGGGIRCSNSSPTITNCTFSGNYAYDGGGMHNCDTSSPTVTNCTFSGNLGGNNGGGMVNSGRSSPTVTNCTFSGNSAGGSGGGMYNAYKSNPMMTNCTFSGNSTSWTGGGMDNHISNPTITNCTFIENSAEQGGGMCNQVDNSPEVTNCTFSGNLAAYGGGMYNNNSDPTVTNCTFSGNFAYDGGGMHNYDTSSPTVTNCTFSGNSAEDCGGGICSSMGDSPTVTNCILWGDSAGTAGTEIGLRSTDYPSTLTISYSVVEGGEAAIYVDPNCILNWGVGNIDIDPCFADPNKGDFHLKSQGGRWDANTESWVQDDVTSPCIDAGDPDASIGYELFPNGGRVNMGAYGGTTEASKSYFGSPICEKNIAGDINGDCIIDFKDFAIMASHWLVNNSP